MACKQFTANEIESIIKKDGWYLVEISGANRQYKKYKHRFKPCKVEIHFNSKSKFLTNNAVRKILKQAKLDPKLFLCPVNSTDS